MPRKKSSGDIKAPLAVGIIVVAIFISSANYQSATALQIVGGGGSQIGTPSLPACLQSVGTINDLAATSSAFSTITLQWTAPSYTNTCNTNKPTYELRYATFAPLTSANFGGTLAPTPLYQTGTQTFTVGLSGGALAACTNYYFGVKATLGSSTYSNSPSKFTTGAPGSPSGLAASASENKATLTWQAPANTCGLTIMNYEIYRGTAAGQETLLTAVGNVLTYGDTTAEGGTKYYYKIKAKTSGGTSGFSSEVSATPTAPVATPTQPSTPATNEATPSETPGSNQQTSGTTEQQTTPTQQETIAEPVATDQTTSIEQTDATQPDATQPTPSEQPNMQQDLDQIQPTENVATDAGTKAENAIKVAESAISIAKNSNLDISKAISLYNEAISAFNNEDYATALAKAKEASTAAQYAPSKSAGFLDGIINFFKGLFGG